jgi:hypothetical protein
MAFACVPNVIKHNQHKAAASAEAFCRAAFVRRDYSEAYEQVIESDKAASTPDSLKALVDKMHPDGVYPSDVRAVEYEPVPGKEAIKIFLRESDDTGQFLYLVLMVGTETNGYRPKEMYRLFEKSFPESQTRRPL